MEEKKRQLGFCLRYREGIHGSDAAACLCLRFFQTSRIGLRAEEVERRRAVFGRNEVEHEKKKNPFSTFIKAFINPFIGVLTVLVVVSFILDVLTADPGEQDWTAIIIISVMVVSSSILKFRQKWKA